MKKQTARHGFTALELVIVVAVVALLIGMFMPSHTGRASRGRASRITCVNNLKQVGIGFRIYATDGAPYPEYQETNEVWRYFQTVGREIGSPKVLLCPTDTARKELKSQPLDFEDPPTASSFAHPKFQNATLSYFYNPDASTNNWDTILSGDRNISTNKNMISGMLNVETNTPVQWTEEDLHKSAGNILLVDGSVQQVSTAKLREQVRLGTNGTQRWLIPK